MTEVTLTRHFDAPPELVFEFVTRPENLVLWWGHDGWTLEDVALDFTREGPWHARMRSEDGNPFHHGGTVTEVTPPRSVSFTWKWDNANGRESGVSSVTFSVTPEDGGSLFTIHHTGLGDDDFGRSHASGWTASLRRLEAFVQSRQEFKTQQE